MRGAELLDILEFVDPGLIAAADDATRVQRTDRRKRSAAAACLGLVAAAALAIPRLLPAAAPTPPDIAPPPAVTDGSGEGSGNSEHAEGPWSPWAAHFNEVSADMALDASRRYIPGYFTEELSSEELAALEPAMCYEYMTYSGHAGFDGGGTLLDVILNVTTPLPDSPVQVLISDFIGCHYELPGEPVTSVCNHTEYTVYQLITGESLRLDARAEIGGHPFRFVMDAELSQPEEAREFFQQVLECFSYWAEGKPDLSAVTAESIPEFFDRKLSLSEARSDPEFGSHMLTSVPTGFVEESIRRYRDQNSDFLSGLWTRGPDSLSWRVSAFTEADAARLTAVADTENYDLALYPIPRAESVPEALREIVDDPIFDAEELTPEAIWKRAYKVHDAGDTDGWRMKFSVKYGGLLVELRSKGVEPEWLYARLAELQGLQ